MDELQGSVGRNGQNRPEDVKQVQHYLNFAGESLTIDGLAGPATIAAIERFQRGVAGLSRPDGLIEPGRSTWKALRAFADKNSELQGSVGRNGWNRPEDVKRVQRYLNLAGQSLTVDGIAGSMTIAAIERFQREIAGVLRPDGLVEPGRTTWKALQTFAGDHQQPSSIAWGARVSQAFKAKVIEIAGRLGVSPGYLMACMAFETGETFDPAIKNAAGSGATGLIQFMPGTARALGTTVEALADMTALEQLDYVEKYFKPYRGKLKTLEDVYMAILYPAAIGKPGSHVLFETGSVAYEQNKGLDEDRDGNITLAEISAKVRAKYEKGLQAEFEG